jgi:uncharacterized repeat protein (TIGR04138 family)
MNQVHLAEELLSRILAREPRYHEQAHLFVLSSIEFLQSRLPFRRHVTGQEVSVAVREHALEQFGLMAPAVLRYWGIAGSVDVGRIVFALVDVGLLVAQPSDRLEDFERVWDLDTGFAEGSYEWRGVSGPGSGGAVRRREAM